MGQLVFSGFYDLLPAYPRNDLFSFFSPFSPPTWCDRRGPGHKNSHISVQRRTQGLPSPIPLVEQDLKSRHLARANHRDVETREHISPPVEHVRLCP